LFIEVDPRVSIFVQDWGKGKPIVFIHGWPLNHKNFEYQMVALMRLGYRAIGVDLRGFGRSDISALRPVKVSLVCGSLKHQS